MKKCIILDRSKTVLHATDRAAFQIGFTRGEYLDTKSMGFPSQTVSQVLVDGKIRFYKPEYVEFVEEYPEVVYEPYTQENTFKYSWSMLLDIPGILWYLITRPFKK